MRPERSKAMACSCWPSARCVMSAFGPKILGRATDLVFSGFIGSQLPAGMTKDQAVEAAAGPGR